jgi:hypothetical protein
LETVIREKQREKRESSNNISNEAVKWRVKNKKVIYWFFFTCFSCSNGKAKQNAK